MTHYEKAVLFRLLLACMLAVCSLLAVAAALPLWPCALLLVASFVVFLSVAFIGR